MERGDPAANPPLYVATLRPWFGTSPTYRWQLWSDFSFFWQLWRRLSVQLCPGPYITNCVHHHALSETTIPSPSAGRVTGRMTGFEAESHNRLTRHRRRRSKLNSDGGGRIAVMAACRHSVGSVKEAQVMQHPVAQRVTPWLLMMVLRR